MGYYDGVQIQISWGEKLRSLYSLLNISRTIFAKRLGISLWHLENIEKGEHLPSQYLIDRICNPLPSHCYLTVPITPHLSGGLFLSISEHFSSFSAA